MNERQPYRAIICPPDKCGAVALLGMDQGTCEDTMTREFNVPAVPYCLHEGVRRMRNSNDMKDPAITAGKCPLAGQIGSICVSPKPEMLVGELVSGDNVL